MQDTNRVPVPRRQATERVGEYSRELQIQIQRQMQIQLLRRQGVLDMYSAHCHVQFDKSRWASEDNAHRSLRLKTLLLGFFAGIIRF